MGALIAFFIMTLLPFVMIYIGYRYRVNSWGKNFIVTGCLLAIPITINFIGLVNALVTGH